MRGDARTPPKRSYRPKVEGLEGIVLLDASSPVVAPLSALVQTLPTTAATGGSTPSHAAWDAALVDASTTTVGVSARDSAAGLTQLDRYLGRTWYRAGIPLQQQDDCTQAVYATLLQQWGRDPFDQMLSDVGRVGIREVLSRDTPEGPEFFRAIDSVKKRAQREKSYQTLDDAFPVAAVGTDGASTSWSNDLHEAIARSLNPREAALIHATIQGQTPAEIAQQWGVAPKTVSNEKTRAFQKLRDALSSDAAS